MKKLAFYTTGLICIVSSILLFSCTKHVDGTDKDYFIDHSFDVGEQSNVSNYQLEVSSDGKDYLSAAVILASELSTDHYALTHINVTKFVRQSTIGRIYIRVKSIDKDGKFKYTQPVERKF